MKKRILVLLTAAAMVFALAGCGSKKEAGVSADVSKLAADLAATVTTGSLAEVAENLVSATYFLDMEKVEETTAYLNSGANSSEVAVVKCKDGDYAAEVKTLFENRVKSQSDLFATYDIVDPTEVEKLDNALIKTAGNYAVLCVTDDQAKAEEILKEAGF